MEDLKTKKYGDLYNHLCSAQFIADEIGDDLADEILRIREKIGKKLLDEYGIKYDLELTKFESTLVRLVNGCSFDRRFLDEERGKYAAKKLLGIAIEEYKQSLWKPADSDDLPEIDREVIALLSNRKVVYAHRPKEYWDGKNIATGEVTRYYPKRYDKGGWNQPDVKWWLDLDLPKMQE